MNILRHIWALKSLWVTVVAFLVPVPLLVSSDPEHEKVRKCAYGIVVMAILWLTEAIPIPVTALMPIFLFPMLGVATAKTMSSSYITDTSMLFLGGLVVAVALVECGLHKRITLMVMRLVGAQPMWLMLGLMLTTWFLSMWISNTAATSMMIPFIDSSCDMLMLGLMLTTWFLSMWISNTAATSMMIPIIKAVLETVEAVQGNDYTEEIEIGADNIGYKSDEEHSVDTNGINVSTIDMTGDGVKHSTKSPTSYNVTENGRQEHELAKEVKEVKRQASSGPDEDINRLAKAFALSVAYGANIGGIATLTGTPPNLVLKQFSDDLYAEKSGDPSLESGISFAQWMGFAFPTSLLVVIVSWFWLLVVFLRCRCFKRMDSSSKHHISSMIYQHYQALGPITFMEIEVMSVFVVLVALWLFRAPPNTQGWGVAFQHGEDKYVSDSTPSILLSVVLFILPAKRPEVFCWTKERPSYTPILTWQKVAANLPWGVIILLGGGFALAKASSDSKLSEWVGEKLEVFAGLDTWLMNLIICCIVAGMTEMTSNTATATLLMPILSSLGISTGIHPLYLMISSAVACSFAFMLPVATPPNAIVFSTGYLSVLDMVLAGFPMNVIAVLGLTFAINTWGYSMYDLGNIPDYFLAPNVTQAALNATT